VCILCKYKIGLMMLTRVNHITDLNNMQSFMCQYYGFKTRVYISACLNGP